MDRTQSTRQYDQFAKEDQAKRDLDKDKDAEQDWKKDAGECAQRIWHWWKPRVKKLPYHALAIRLIVLAQLTSCSVERVFSK